MKKKTKCETKGRHEYQIVLENDKRIYGVCKCGKSLVESKS